MADENTEEKKKGGILKLLMFIGGGILLIGIGLGVGFFLFGGKPADPSAEIEEIIERKMKEAEEAKAAEEAANADPDKKIAPEVENFVTTYYEFSGTFTTNLRNSTKFLQVGIGVSTQYDEKVMEVVDSHQLALRSEILSTISDFTEEDISGSEGKKKLSERLIVVLNKKLESLDEFPGIEDVYFTAFILQ